MRPQQYRLRSEVGKSFICSRLLHRAGAPKNSQKRRRLSNYVVRLDLRVAVHELDTDVWPHGGADRQMIVLHRAARHSTDGLGTSSMCSWGAPVVWPSCKARENCSEVRNEWGLPLWMVTQHPKENRSIAGNPQQAPGWLEDAAAGWGGSQKVVRTEERAAYQPYQPRKNRGQSSRFLIEHHCAVRVPDSRTFPM